MNFIRTALKETPRSFHNSYKAIDTEWLKNENSTESIDLGKRPLIKSLDWRDCVLQFFYNRSSGQNCGTFLANSRWQVATLMKCKAA